MRPQAIGRFLGIGIRVACRIVGRQLAGQAQAAAGAAGQMAARAASGSPAQGAGRMAARNGGGVMKGVGGFLRPFRRVGGILWLEVTGVFFLLPVVVFTPRIWNTRMSWAHGPDHRTFVASIVVVAVFLSLGVTSFWRAWHR